MNRTSRARGLARIFQDPQRLMIAAVYGSDVRWGKFLHAALRPPHDAKEISLRPKLLIVEDDASMREVWEVIFGTRGWDVAVATTLAEGLAMLDPSPDFLILDLKLPDGGGEAILRKVREDGLKTRVAVTTASNDPTQLSEVRSLEPEALFEKPVNVADVWRRSEWA